MDSSHPFKLPEDLDWRSEALAEADMHLLSEDLQIRFKETTDPVRLRLFACRCALLALDLCEDPDPRCRQAIEVAEHYTQGLVTLTGLESAHALVEHVVQAAGERDTILYNALQTSRATLQEAYAARIFREAVQSASACLLSSARLAAVTAAIETDSAFRERSSFQAKQLLLSLGEQLLDSAAPWHVGVEEWLLKARLQSLPPPLALLVQQASDTSLRLFACRCATVALDISGQRDRRSLQAVAVAERHGRGQATVAELEAAYLEAEKASHEAMDRAQGLTLEKGEESGKPENKEVAFAAGLAAQSACACAHLSAKLAAAVAADNAGAALQDITDASNERLLVALADQVLVKGLRVQNR